MTERRELPEEVAAEALAQWLNTAEMKRDPHQAGDPPPVILDVREPWEYERDHIPGSYHVPVGQVPLRLREIDAMLEAGRPLWIVCEHGRRSLAATRWLRAQGRVNVQSAEGGMERYRRFGGPLEKGRRP